MDLFDDDLEQFLIKNEQKLDEKIICLFAEQIARAVNYLKYQYSIAHRDVKPSNIFVRKSQKTNKYELKLGDFDTAKYFKDRVSTDNPIGTPFYFSNELALAYNKGSGLSYNPFISEIFTLGINFIRMMISLAH